MYFIVQMNGGWYQRNLLDVEPVRHSEEHLSRTSADCRSYSSSSNVSAEETLEVVDSRGVGNEGSEVEEAGDAIVHHHLSEETRTSQTLSSSFRFSMKQGSAYHLKSSVYEDQ